LMHWSVIIKAMRGPLRNEVLSHLSRVTRHRT
jgi:hypothetical protein